MNIFEGARRIAYTLLAVVTVFAVSLQFQEEPYVTATYRIDDPLAAPVRLNMATDCPKESATEYLNKETTTGDDVSVTLCFPPQKFSTGEMLVPFKVDEKNYLWGGEFYSDEVDEYTEKFGEKFTIPSADSEFFAQETSSAYREQWWEFAKTSTIFLAIFFAVFWAIGWIVRGFMGIPRGMDRKPD